MTVEEFYTKVNGSYADALSRFLTDQRILKYLHKLPLMEDYNQMMKCYIDQNWQDFFRYAHNVKGMALNLCLTEISDAAAVVCDIVRHGPPTEDVEPPLRVLKAAWFKAVKAIEEF